MQIKTIFCTSQNTYRRNDCFDKTGSIEYLEKLTISLIMYFFEFFKDKAIA